MKRRWRELPIAVGMLAPSAVILGIFVVYPLVRAVQLGHLRCDATGKRCREGGWGQYIDVFRSNEFQHALANTARLALMTVPVGLALGIGLAVLADKQIRGIGFFRTVFSSTVATSVAVASLVWFVLLQPEVGVLPDLLHGIIPSLKQPGLLRDPGTALPAVALSSIWASLGFTFIVMTAALQGIPRELYESAFVDGAGGWMRFSNVTLPMLGPTILFTSVVLTTRAFQAYAEIALLTGGGPDPQRPTQSVAYLIYGQNSLVKNDIGLKSASAVLLFVVLLVLALVQFRGLDKRVHYGS
ncbi:MAG TPA: sugar ABC transporter permease [Ilumatobacteraceae bacterium]|nr:sugar ABC transporter permease [Ilumatobacteraceae bacterium]